jgi:hypothetical protein
VRVRDCIRRAKAWWSCGSTPSWRWQAYFYYHTVSVALFSVFAILDSRRIYPENLIAEWPSVVRFALYCALGVVFWSLALLAYVGPFLSLRLLWLARKGSPSFVAFALCDTFATILQYVALLVACS